MRYVPLREEKTRLPQASPLLRDVGVDRAQTTDLAELARPYLPTAACEASKNFRKASILTCSLATAAPKRCRFGI